jgi:hypothetical protein
MREIVLERPVYSFLLGFNCTNEVKVLISEL